MEKEYYYLDEKEQKGPFNIDQLKTVVLNSETLVWADGFENWKPIKDVEELKGLLKKSPPPPPINDNSQNSANQPLKENKENKKILVEDSNVKFWASFKICAASLFLLGLAAFTAYLISSNKTQTLKKEIYSKVDNILDGKTVVLDGITSLTQGELKETNYSKSKNKSNDPDANLINEWWKAERLYTIFEAYGGGFTIKQLTKQYDDGYDIETYSSGNMGYKKPSGSYVAPKYMDMGWGEKVMVGGGYYSSNYRLPVRQCYTKAFEYFTKEDKISPGAFTPGKYIDISNFPDIRNEYFYMDNITPKKYVSSGIHAPSWSNLTEYSANINTEDWVVYYSKHGKHYEITEYETAIRNDLFTYLGITVGSIMLLLTIGYFAKPQYFRNLNLFGKRWKNIAHHEQIFFFEHSFFGRHTFIEIINETVSKGVLKFTDKGNTVNLSYPNKELFYKIEKINQDDLILLSIKDMSSITLERVGAKDKVNKEDKIESTNNEEVKQDEQTENEDINK